MPTNVSTDPAKGEPLRRFYPPEGAQPKGSTSQIPSDVPPQKRIVPGNKRGDAAYLIQRHPLLLQRLYQTTETLLDTYPEHSFLFDAYPDYLSLHVLRDRLLRENPALTEAFLQEGCPFVWLNSLADLVLSDLLCRKRCTYRSPKGEANTTSVRFSPRL